MKRLMTLLVLVFPLAAAVFAQQESSKILPAGSKVFIAAMDDGFHEYLKAAFEKKKVPVVLVEDRAVAEFEISGHSESQKASTAKKVILWDWRSNEQASIQITNLKSSEVIFAYAVNKQSSSHGKKSTAEACAKHLIEKIESKQ